MSYHEIPWYERGRPYTQSELDRMTPEEREEVAESVAAYNAYISRSLWQRLADWLRDWFQD